MTEIFIHIGLPRTGTTFLQENVFPKLDLEYFCKDYIRIMKNIEFRFSDKILLSDEGLYGNCYIPYEEDTRYVTLKRINSLFDSPKIIVGVRNKHDWVNSMYARSVSEGNPQTFNDWFDSINKNYLDIDNYVFIVKKIFYEENVHIFDFDKFKKNNYSEVNKLCMFLGVDTPVFHLGKKNSSMGNFQINILRRINKYFYHYVYNKNGVLPGFLIHAPIRFITTGSFFPNYGGCNGR